MSSDKWKDRDLQRLRNENRMLRTEYARSKARIAELELQIMFERDRDLTDKAWLQGKVRRQKAALNALQGRAEAERIVMESEE